MPVRRSLRRDRPGEACARHRALVLRKVRVLGTVAHELGPPKAILQEAEARVTELGAALQAPAKPAVVALPTTVERYLSEPKGILNRDNAHARHILAKLI